MLIRLFSRGWMLVVVTAVMLSFPGCSESCEDEHTLCLSKVGPSLTDFSYDVTCRYPSMNSGNPRVFCECEDQYQACMAK